MCHWIWLYKTRGAPFNYTCTVRLTGWNNQMTARPWCHRSCWNCGFAAFMVSLTHDPNITCYKHEAQYDGSMRWYLCNQKQHEAQLKQNYHQKCRSYQLLIHANMTPLQCTLQQISALMSCMYYCQLRFSSILRWSAHADAICLGIPTVTHYLPAAAEMSSISNP